MSDAQLVIERRPNWFLTVEREVVEIAKRTQSRATQFVPFEDRSAVVVEADREGVVTYTETRVPEHADPVFIGVRTGKPNQPVKPKRRRPWKR